MSSRIPSASCNLRDVLIVVVNDGDPVRKGGEMRSCRLDGILILIDADKPSALREPFCDLIGVASAAERPVDVDAGGPDVQICNGLLKKDRDVVKFHGFSLPKVQQGLRS